MESAKQRGIKPTARLFATTVPTVRKWLRRFEQHGPSGLREQSRARHRQAHKTPSCRGSPTESQLKEAQAKADRAAMEKDYIERIKVRGTIDGQAFKSSFMAMGDGRHMLPVKTEVRRLIGKEAGKTVKVVLKGWRRR